MFTIGFEKMAAKAKDSLAKETARAAGRVGKKLMGKAKAVGSHISANRNDYMKGATAAGAIGTAIGVNRKNKK